MANKRQLLDILAPYSDDAIVSFEITGMSITAKEPEPAPAVAAAEPVEEVVAPVEEVKAE